MYITLYSIFVLSILIITIDGETCPMKGDIRYDSSSGQLQGALQVCEFPTGSSSLQWLYVCNNNWDNGFHESDTWCRQLGYVESDGADKTNIIDSGVDKLTNVDCNQNDMRIIDCNYNLDNSECEYEKDVKCTKCNNNNQCNTPGTCNTATGKCECIGECMNGGYCYLGMCICPTDFTGSQCEDCNPACQNNGLCNSSGVCVCPYGYTGSTCETVSTTLMTTTTTPLTITTTSTPLTTTSTPLTTTTASTPLTTTSASTPLTTTTASTPLTTTTASTPLTTTTASTPLTTTSASTPITTTTAPLTTTSASTPLTTTTAPLTTTTASTPLTTTATSTPLTTTTASTPLTTTATSTPLTTTSTSTPLTTITASTPLTTTSASTPLTTTIASTPLTTTTASTPLTTTATTQTTTISVTTSTTQTTTPDTTSTTQITTPDTTSTTQTTTPVTTATTQITSPDATASNITQQSTTSITEELNSSMGLVIGLTFVLVLFILFCIIVTVSAMVLFYIYRRSYLKKIKGTFDEPITTNLLYRNNPMKQLDPYYSSILNNITSPINVSEYEFINPDLSMSADYLDFGSSITANVKSTHNGIEVRHLPPVNEDYIYSNIEEYTDYNAEQIYETYINEMYEAFSESEDRNQDIYGIYEQISNLNENEAIVLNSNQREEQSFLDLSKTIKQQEYEIMIAPPPPKQTSYATNTHATTHANITINANAANNSIVEAMNKEKYIEPPKSLRKLFDTLSSKKCREINPDLLKMEKEVGSGAFGVVYMATWDSNYGPISVAVKQLKHSTEVHKIGIMQEAAIMRQFNHPNVLSLIGVVSLEEPYMIVTELMKGELKDILLKMKESKIDEFKFSPVLLKFTREIAEGMKHLSERGFIHRDLAARNVLIARDLTCRIADFGMSRQVTEDDEYYKSKGGQIPLRWTAPEAVWYRRFSLSSDVWSFGMTMFEIWSLGLKPWLDYTPKQIIEAFSNQQIHLAPTGCPKEVYRIMIKACNYEPEIRPNFMQICQMLQQPVALLLKRKVTSNAADKLGNDPQLAEQF